MTWDGLEAQAIRGARGLQSAQGQFHGPHRASRVDPGFGTRLGGERAGAATGWSPPGLTPQVIKGPREAWRGDPQSPRDLLGLNSTDSVPPRGPWDPSRLEPHLECGDRPARVIYHEAQLGGPHSAHNLFIFTEVRFLKTFIYFRERAHTIGGSGTGLRRGRDRISSNSPLSLSWTRGSTSGPWITT